MVFVENGNNPICRYSTIELAEAEAKRLSKKLGKKAWVLSTIKSFEINEFLIKDCRPDMCLPF